MCGISVILSTRFLTEIQPMTDLIRHRGPDDEGFAFFSDQVHLFGGKETPEAVYKSPLPYTPSSPFDQKFLSSSAFLAMGHRRLSVIDLSSAGHQPLSDSTGRFWIVYNGEIYNHNALRKELLSDGFRFHSETDTEVILASYQKWGTDCLNRFHGMFAFVIYDTEQREIFVARDRFGIKPLYYWNSPKGFLAIASEVKQLTVLPGWEANLNGQAAYDFLNYGVLLHEAETLFKGVYQLEAGHYFTQKIGIEFPKPKCWYSLPHSNDQSSFQASSKTFSKLFLRSVEEHLRSDVTVGSCLSGGLDSSSIVCSISHFFQSKKQPQMTFSACSHEKAFDEREYVEEVVRKTGVDPRYTYPSLEELFEQARSILWHQDFPFGSTSIFAQWEVFKSAKQEKVKVMLDGQGADELLAGYPNFVSHSCRDLFQRREWHSLWQEIKQPNGLASFAKLAFTFLPSLVQNPLREFFGKPVVNPPWINMGVLGASPMDLNRWSHPGLSSLGQESHRMVTRTSLPMLLHYEDRDSMAHSVEARVPFLDHRLVEFLFSLPNNHKISQGVTKKVLREGMRGILPEKIRTRKTKLGFATPERAWICSQCPDQFRGLVRKAVEGSQGILNEKAIQIADEIISGKRAFSFFIWRLIIFSEWLELFRV